MPSPFRHNSTSHTRGYSKLNSVRRAVKFINWQPNLPPTFDYWWSNLSPEFRVMLACLRLNPSEAEIRQIAELSRSQINWLNLLSLVDRHRTAPLLYRNLKRYGTNIPAFIMSQLSSRFEANARRSLTNTAELVRLYKLFQENNISFIPLKGSVLASQVYGNLALRHAGDLDLLVAPQQVELADKLLQTKYRRVLPNYRLTPAQHRHLIRSMHHFEYQQDQGNLRLDLHWRPIHDQAPAALNFSQLVDRASEVPVAGLPLPTLSLQDNILYLCGHGGNHFWFRMFWLVDLAEIIRQNRTIAWPRLLTLANAAGLTPQLLSGVFLAHKLLSAPLSEEVQIQARRNPLGSFIAQISCRYLLCSDPEDRPLSSRLNLNVCRLRTAHSLADKLNILQDIFLGQEWMVRGNPQSLCLSYLMRLPLWLQKNQRRRRN